jgi:hypothetical protein
MNTFMNGLQNATNYGRTANNALTHRTTNSALLDMFALGGAYRARTDDDCILLFKNALEEDEVYALKCLFYLRDVRGGQGERRFFRVCMKWLAKKHPEIARRNLKYISEYGRWDDLYVFIDTPLQAAALGIMKKQLELDVQCKTPSLLAKWMKSENTSSEESRRLGNITRSYLGMTHKQYRKTLSILRERINVLERLMSAGKWDEIEFDKIPSKAGLKYKNAFARRDIIKAKYEAFAKDENTKVNAGTLYPYEVVAKAADGFSWSYSCVNLSETDREMINKYWENLPDYLEGKPCKMMCVVDTSGSMTGNDAAAPINVAIGLGMYCAERVGGPFKNHYISFSSRPQLIKIQGTDFVDKVRRIYNTNLCENTNIEATFELLKQVALTAKKEDRPDTIVIISDMEIDYMTGGWRNAGRVWSEETAATEMERIRRDWEACGLECPRLVYWNVAARQDNILDLGPNVSFVSGASPIVFKQVLTGKTGEDLMYEVLNGDRYAVIR